ncbi:CAP domain-containing protein [Ectobacillus sp. sgz5001026]|uniref:CAP domain-containing protein n=1 Tax=Ectobacillus sp. sgz5001026 TaxID=3242473 RepID=UPI0036D3C8BD
MKKTLLLSLATAAAFTFGVSSHDAKAASLQPETTNHVTYSAFQFLYEPMNQQDFQSFLNTFFKNQMTWKIVMAPQTTYPNITPAPTPAPVSTQTQQSTPAPTQTQQSTPAPTQTQQSTPAPTQTKQSTPAPTQTKQSTPTPTQTKQSTPAPTPAPQQGVLSAYEQKVVDLTNAERAKNGLGALKVDATLSKVAKAKSQDMNNLNYFDHTSPTYGSPFDMMKQFGITYTTAGENIAMGQQTPEEVVQAWMASPGHRANILNNTYTYIGVGYVSGKNIWTQEFISK